MYKNRKNTIKYWVKWMIQDPNRVEDFRGNLEELLYVIKKKPNPLCWLGMHKIVRDITWYYEPDFYCARCDEQDATNWRIRYTDWASMHSMHPFAWPFTLYYSIVYWWYDKTHPE
jgi:hypothetical protein